MITVLGRGMYWRVDRPMFLLLVDGQEPERALYRLMLSQGQGLIIFIPGAESNFTEDAVSGRFRMYDVKNKQTFKDGVYLELCVSIGKWDCYIMPTGLPDQNILEKNIFVTCDCITKMTSKD